jgi:transposase
MTKHPIEVITSVERRRRWPREDKERLVAACLEPDAVLSEIARAAGTHVSQLFRWRKELCRVDETSTPTVGTLVPVIVSEKKQNAKLRLEVAEACCESRVLLRPFEGTRICCWVGANERSEFTRNTLCWKTIGLGASTARAGFQLTS